VKNDQVILVNESNFQRGIMGKMEAHIKAELHRAFSIFIFNSKGELLLQKRALTKYHSGGLWTNTCCGHPQPKVNMQECAHERLKEEMGIDCAFEFAFDFIYKADLDNGLFENELDHVFVGHYDGIPTCNPLEASHWKYESLNRIRENVKVFPEQFTVWFKLILPKLSIYLNNKNHDEDRNYI